MPKKISLIGLRFGRLIVVKEVAPVYYGTSRKTCYECLCDCGKTANIVAMSLRSGASVSCGCGVVEATIKRNFKHGFSTRKNQAKIYTLWEKMINRCTCKTSGGWENYGARGIVVCERWRKFENFFADMGYRPPGKTLGRRDNDGPYSPDNCRWETPLQQGANRRTNRVFTVMGITAHVAELARRFGINKITALSRIDRYGWTPHDAFTKPPWATRHKRNQKPPKN